MLLEVIIFSDELSESTKNTDKHHSRDNNMNEEIIHTLKEKLEIKSTETKKATKRWEEADTELVALFNKED